MSIVSVVVSDFSHCLKNHGAKEDTKVGAHDVHESNHGRVLAVVDYDVGVLEDKERLREYEYDGEYFSDYADYESDSAALEHARVVYIGLDHLNETETAVDQCAYGENGRADAHVEFTRAVLVVVGEVELGQVSRVVVILLFHAWHGRVVKGV
jgi:hypothetical protein